GAPADLSPAHSEVLQFMFNPECHFINGTERVRFVERYIYNREQLMQLDSDLGYHVGDTPFGELWARAANSDPQWMEYQRSTVDRHCRHNYEVFSPFTVERRVPPSPFQSL
ncbi:HB2J protein, partial [Campylorhamphus procurvoides]|nr:HB2J protein [Campylorhamphus procurvoides]